MEELTIWGLHAGKTGDARTLFMEHDVVALGWMEFGDLSGYAARDEFKDHYAEIYPEVGSQSIATSAGQLFRFVHEVREGDLVVYPERGGRDIHIGRVKGPYKYRPDVDNEYPNQRQVEWLVEVPRTRFSQAALYEMGAAMSLFQIRNYADEIIAVVEGRAPEEAPVDEDLSAQAEDILDQTRDFVLKRLERSQKGLALEGFVQHLLEKMGYNARLMRRNEPGVDLIAHKDELGFEPPVIKVQVKSGAGKVTDQVVSAFYGKVQRDEFGLLITLGEFTAPAITFANSKSNLRLIDGTELVDLIFEHYEGFDPQYKAILPLKSVYVPQSIDQEA